MGQFSRQFREAIEQLYVTFASYTVETLVGCPHCTSDEHGRFLASQPVRSLTAEDLRNYSFKAMTTWGTVADYKHFLPRVFELFADEAFSEWVDSEIILKKLAYGNWQAWPVAEQSAIDGYLRSLWRHLLATYPCRIEADACLCGIGGSVDDMYPYLDEWAKDDGMAAAFHLADFVAYNAGGLRPKKGKRGLHLANAFWQDRPAQAAQVWTWLIDPARGEAIERAFFAYGEKDPDGKLSDAFNQIGHLHSHIEQTCRDDHG